MHAVADDHQAGLTLERRAELGPQRVAGRVGGLVEGQVEEVGRLRGLGAAPAHLEAEARGRLRGTRGRDLQPIAAEADRRLDPARTGGREVDGAAGDAPGGLDRLERPAPVRPIPLVGGIDPRQGPAHARPGEERPVGAREHHVEARDPALLQVGEALAQGEDRAGREDRQGQAARQRPAAGLADRQRDLRLQGARGRDLGHRHRDGGPALRVRGGMLLQFLRRRLHGLVVETDGVGLEPLDAAGGGRLHGHAARHVEVRPRGAVEVAGGDVDLRGLAPVQGRLPGLEGHLQPLGDVILHEEAGLADRGRLRVRVGRDPPRPVHRPRQERQRQGAAAEPLVGHRDAPVLDAVRPLDHQGQRQVRHGGAAGIAQQGGELDGLARAVDPALREQVGVEAAGLGPPLHAAVGKVEGAEVEVEEAVIAARLGDHEARRQAALPAGETRIEGDMPLRIRGPRAQHLVVAGDQPDLGARHHLRGGQRAQDHGDPVPALGGGESQVGDHEPLGRLRIVFLVGGGRARGAGQHHVEAGLQLAHGLQHREGGDGLLIDLGLGGVEGALPDALALLGGDRPGGGAAELAQEVLRPQGRQQAAVADAQHLDVELGRVHRDQGHARLPRARQDVVAPGEAHLRGAVADVDLVVGGLEQALADGRRQAGADHDGVAAAMLEPIDADLGALPGHRGRAATRDGDEGGVVGLGLDRLREGEAGPRGGRVGIDLVIEDAEAVLRPQGLVGLPDRTGLGQGEARRVGVQRRAPGFLLGLCRPQGRQRRRGVGGRAGALVGAVGGGRHPTAQARPALIVVVLERAQGRRGPARIGLPVARVGRVGRHRGGERRQRFVRLVGGEQGQPGGAGLAGRPQRSPGFRLQRGLQADRSAGEVGPDEALRERRRCGRHRPCGRAGRRRGLGEGRPRDPSEERQGTRELSEPRHQPVPQPGSRLPRPR